MDTNNFLSLPKIVSVALICVICSFFSAARRTNQEAPPLLSGFWVRRYGRRRGLRNSLCSDGPRPFSSVFLATSPPDKGGDFASLFTPLALRALPLYSLTETQGERRVNSITFTEGIFNPSVLTDTSPIFCGVKHPVRLRLSLIHISEPTRPY